MEIFTRVLHQYFIQEEDIREYVSRIRDDNYTMLRPLATQKSLLELPDWHHYKVNSMRVQTNDHNIVNIPLKESRIKNKYGVTILAIQRGEVLMTEIHASQTLEQGDVIHVFGDVENINAFGQALKG